MTDLFCFLSPGLFDSTKTLGVLRCGLGNDLLNFSVSSALSLRLQLSSNF
jgi:hypothetical protein